MPSRSTVANVLFDLFKLEEIISLVAERQDDIKRKTQNCKCSTFRDSGSKRGNIKQRHVSSGARESSETGLQKLQSGTVSGRGGACGALGPDRSFFGPALPLCQPESLRSPGSV